MNVVQIAAYYQRARTAKPRVVVLHDPGQPELNGVPEPVSAAGVATFNSKPQELRSPPGVGGYHVVQDAVNTVRCAPDDNRVNGAAGANDDGLHLCFADYSSPALVAGAAVVAGWCAKYGIPTKRIGPQEFNAGQAGIVSHADVEIAIRAQSPHTDPRSFPWETFMRYVAPPAPAPLPVKVAPMHPAYTATWSADCDSPSGGAWILTADGGVITVGSAQFHGSPAGLEVKLGPGETWNEIRVPNHALPGEPLQRPASMGGGPTSYVCVTSADHRYGF